MGRIDKELVNRGLFESRNKALYALRDKIIYCNDKCITKASYYVCESDIIEVRGQSLKYVSRGGLKLEKALNEFNIDLKDKVMLDIGSSTGGFCHCAILNGIKKIYAIDVGSQQLSPLLRNNNKILLYENTDFRNTDSSMFYDVDIVSIDVSFISVIKLLDKLNEIKSIKSIICLIKPQFECGKELSDKYKGKPVNREVHYDVIRNVINSFSNYNYYLSNLTFSPVKGGDGNIEYLAHFTRNDNARDIDILNVINASFSKL